MEKRTKMCHRIHHGLQIVVAVCFLFFGSLTAVAKKEVTPTRLAIMGDLRGEVKPCGCSADGDMGGLLRRATFFEQQRKDAFIVYLDAGNNFPIPSDQGALKIELLQHSLKIIAPAAILIGPNEWAYGLESLSSELPYFVSNSIGTQLPFPKNITVTSGQATFQIWGYLSPTQIYQNSHAAQSVVPVSPELLKQWKTRISKEEGREHILIFRGNEVELEQFEKAGLFDLVIAGSNNDDELNQVLTMNTPRKTFSAIPTKGQGALLTSFADGKYSKLTPEWLTSAYEDHPKVLPLFNTYDERVKALFFANIERREKQIAQTPYAGEKACKTCHLDDHAVWEGSRHAGAFQTLKDVKKQFDPECLQCHVVGLDNKGFVSPELTPDFRNVQCENCHGPAKQHAQNPVQFKPKNPHPTAETCQTCHHGSHSPKFDFSKYWPKIQHGPAKQRN